MFAEEYLTKRRLCRVSGPCRQRRVSAPRHVAMPEFRKVRSDLFLTTLGRPSSSATLPLPLKLRESAEVCFPPFVCNMTSVMLTAPCVQLSTSMSKARLLFDSWPDSGP